jgi:hypothetical protein
MGYKPNVQQSICWTFCQRWLCPPTSAWALKPPCEQPSVLLVPLTKLPLLSESYLYVPFSNAIFPTAATYLSSVIYFDLTP